MKIYDEIDKQIKTNKKVIIAIDGPSASGKSTLGNLLKQKYDALLFHTDNYFLPPKRKTKERLAESGGNVDYERIKSDIFDNIDSEFIQSDHFNCKTNILEEAEPLRNKQVIVIEGAYSLHKSLFPYYTLTVLLEIDESLQRDRILARNGEQMLKRWIEEWIPLEEKYFKEEELKTRVDIIFNLSIKNYYSLSWYVIIETGFLYFTEVIICFTLILLILT